MSADPLDKQLVEAVLSRPRRAKADLEEAKMAGLRPSRPKAGVAVAGDDDDDDDEEELDPSAEGAEDGVRPAFDLVGLIVPLDPEIRRLADGLVAVDRPRPEPREVERLLIDIESIQLRDRDEYIESALSEAERAADTETIGRLMVEKIQINEARLSLDRRRDQTRLLAGNRR